MNKKAISIILAFLGVFIMLSAFIVVPDSKPWYYEVLLFDIGLVLSMIPKYPKLKEKYLKR